MITKPKGECRPHAPPCNKAPIRLDQIHRALGGSGYRAFCRQRRRQLRQCSRRNHQRSLQSRGHPSARTVAVIRGCRVRDAGVGGLVQQSPAAGDHRQHPASRSRGTLLCHDRATRHGGVTQTKQPPANPGRFRSPNLRSFTSSSTEVFGRPGLCPRTITNGNPKWNSKAHLMNAETDRPA